MPRGIPKNKNIDDQIVKPEEIKVEPKVEAITNSQVQKRVKSKAEQMKDHLESQPKVSILIPLERGENKGSVQPFCINGYRFSVPKGVMTSVPEQVAQMVSDRFQVDLEVRNRAIGRTDVKNALE
jgi:hypothetical protein